MLVPSLLASILISLASGDVTGMTDKIIKVAQEDLEASCFRPTPRTS